MKVLVTLRRPSGMEPTNVQITADGTATVGDVAHAIASCAESGCAAQGGDRFTLRRYDDAGGFGRDLHSRLTLLNSGITSGSHIEVVPPSDGTDAGQAVAVLSVVSGPDRGVEVVLPRGSSTLGRGADCSVRLSDPRVSKRHAEVLITDRVEIIDLNSANGVETGGMRVARTVLKSGDTARVGESVVQVRLLQQLGPTAASTDIVFVRSPRLIARPRVQEVKAPEVPAEPQPNPFPLLMMIAPLIMGVVLFLFTKSALSVVFVALSPILMLGTWVSASTQARRKRKLDTKQFREAVSALDAKLADGNEAQRLQMLEMFPSLDACLGAMGQLGNVIWSRRPELPEFGQLRLGVGDVKSVQQVKVESHKGRQELLAELNAVVDERSTVCRAPVVADLAECGSLGVAGATEAAAMVARGIVLQFALTHAPTEALLACLTSAAGESRWRWMQWLPHVNRPISMLGPVPLASDEANGRRLLENLEELIDSRLRGAGQPHARGPAVGRPGAERSPSRLPLVIVVIDESPVDLARLIRLAERGPDAGVHVVWVDRQVVALPAACRTYLDAETSTVGFLRSETAVTPIESEGLDLETALVAARAMAPLADASDIAEDESDVPSSVSMVNLLGAGMSDNVDQVLAHWQENGSLINRQQPAVPREHALPLRALVGHTGVEAFTLDLRTQGPHALVGGTTGAGKSEFLQAWLLGMAAAYSPDRLTFLLVDYKGGTAFAHCVKLPHCVGLVTDLSRHLVGRALQSLRAEIHHREILLNEKGAKDLIELESRGDPDCPPSLIIVVDEFAALKMEFPEFVDGMVDVAQRGRSLGLHLILATQRPAGVIGDNIRANTNLRIALRMNDEADSKDIIDDVMSAHIAPETPGRGVARVGPGRLRKFQSGYPGSHTPLEPEQAPVDLQEVWFGKRQTWKIPRPPLHGPKVDKDIERVVATVSAAAEKGAVPVPRRPWLPELSPVYDLLKLRQRRDDELVLGVVDDPDHQDQRVEYFRPDQDINLLIVGAGGSGKTTALRTLALAASITPRTGPVHVYGMDFTGRGLVSLEAMPNVGSIVPGSDEERIARLLRTLDAIITERGGRYTAVNASNLPEYREIAHAPDESRILLLIDGYSAFQEEYYIGAGKGHLFQLFQRVLSDGRAVGVHVAITLERAGAVASSVHPAFQRKVVLRLSDENAYLDMGVPKDALSPTSPPGRAILAPGNLELQLACIGGRAGVADQVREMELLAQAVAPHHTSRPDPIRSLPALVRLSELPKTRTAIVGVSDVTLAPMAAPASGLVMITGPRGSGKSNAVAVYAQSLREAHPNVRLIHLSAGRTPISGLGLWTRSAVGVSEVGPLLVALLDALPSGAAGRPAFAVFCEGAPALSEAGLGVDLTALARRLQDTDNLFVAEGAADAWGSAYDLLPALKGSRQVLALQLAGEAGYSVLDDLLPKLARADLVPGRGFWVDRMGTVKVQVPVHL